MYENDDDVSILGDSMVSLGLHIRLHSHFCYRGNLFTLDQIGLCVAEGTYIYYSYKRSGPLLRRAYSPRFCHLLFWTVYATPVIFFLPVIPCILTLADSFFIAGDIADILSMAFNLLAATFVVVFEGILLRAFLYSMRRSAESMAESRPEFKVIAVCGSIACVTFLFGLFLYCLGRLAFPQKSLGYGLCIFLSIVLPSVGVSHMLVMKVWLFCIRRGDGMSGRRSTYVVR
ncbi:hypothetical protein BC830DRAFT_656252 [Chytriomyces sp. MP71]|nr:hypothetical protein BC830DRAFT_656252 [Chytriomyces sp. MP71]